MLPRTRHALSELLERTFPHAEDIDAATLDAFIDGLMRARAEASEAGENVASPQRLDPDAHLVLNLVATHARRTPVTSVFTSGTYCVWVRLPQHVPETIETALGEVLPEDHLLPTVDAVRERFGERIGRPFVRVDLLTPPRNTTRFAPMSLYFGYLEVDDETPAFVIYAPGDATGKPGALYLGETVDTVIEEPAGYKPTPLAEPSHWYTGGIRMSPDGRVPDVLYMNAAEVRGAEPHFRLHAEYSPVEELPTLIPGGGIVEAALRMLAVQKGVGLDQNLIERLVAETGLLALPWTDRPDNGAPLESTPHGLSPAIETEVFAPCEAFDPFIAELPGDERELFQASIAMLLGAVVHADGSFDRLERVEIDWRMNFEVPRELGDAFRFSLAAEREHRALMRDKSSPDPRPFDARLRALGAIVARLPAPLRARYCSFVLRACRAAAEASGEWLWFGAKVGEEEREILERIGHVLELAAHDGEGRSDPRR